MPSGRVLLLGDSLRLIYQPRVVAELEKDGLTVFGPEGSCGDSAAMAEAVGDWLAEFEPDICCFACSPFAREAVAWRVSKGVAGDGDIEIEMAPLARYERDLLRTAETVRRFCGRQSVFITIAPVHTERFGANGSGRDGEAGHMLNRSIAQYNQVAMGLLGELNIAVTDLHHELSRYADDGLGPDGVGLTDRGIAIATEVVCRGVYGVLHS